jgi:thermitase
MLSTIAFWIVLPALAGWYFVENQKFTPYFRLIVLLGLALAGVGWGMSAGTAGEKAPWLIRELLLLSASGLWFFVSKKKQVPGWQSLLLAAAIAFWTQYLWPKTQHQVEVTALDPSGEWLVLPKQQPAATARLRRWAADRQIRVRTAFVPAEPQATALDEYLIFDLPDGSPQAATWQQELLQSGLVDWLEPNELLRLPTPVNLPGNSRNTPTLAVNDPQAAQQWALGVLEINKIHQWIEQGRIKARKRALIAILDTGVDAQHEDLAANYTSLKKQYDNDPKGHGTHCAGIAAAVTHNRKGVAGWSKSNDFVRVTSIKVLNANGMGSQESIIDGIIEAADKGADVISLSLGGFSNQSRQRAYEQAVAYAARKSAIVVAAAGNFNRPATGFAPANAKGVIAVAAVDANLNRAPFSNYLNQIEMPLAAPGVDILSTVPANGYQSFSGTSMAAPYVAGAIGMLRSLQPSLQAAQAFELLHETGRVLPAGAATGRLIQPAAALQRLMEKNEGEN